MRNIPMDLLRSFVTVAEMRGFTLAGQLLGRSQPAVSLQIKRLEELIDAQVFIRGGQQRLELTLIGERMLGYARQILALNDEALAELTQPTITGRIRFGIPSEFATTLLPKVLGRFAQSYPAVTLEITSDLSENLFVQHLGQYDLILGLQDAPSKSRPSYIGADDLVWVTSPSYDTHLRSPLPLIVAPAPCLYRSRAIRTLKMSGRPWRISYTNQDITGIKAAIEEGLGVTVLAQKTVPESLRILPFSDKFPKLGKVGIHLVYKKERASEAVLKLVDYVSTIMG
jgi:DNA-binding transcriptional LysR family regulator